MAIDNATYIGDMNINSPADIDDVAEGAGQIRAVKAALQRTFPMLGQGEAATTFGRTPLGGIIFYSGSQEALSAYPEWALCNGDNVNSIQTPNLTDKFIMGGGFDDIGKTGGSNERDPSAGLTVDGHALSISEMPSHDHTLPYNAEGSGGGGGGPDRLGGTGAITNKNGGGAAHSHGLTGESVDNRPAYYTLAYIMFVGYPA